MDKPEAVGRAFRLPQLDIPFEVNPARRDALVVRTSTCLDDDGRAIRRLAAFADALGGKLVDGEVVFDEEQLMPFTLHGAMSAWIGMSDKGKMVIVGRSGDENDSDVVIFLVEDEGTRAQLERFQLELLAGDPEVLIRATYWAETMALTPEERIKNGRIEVGDLFPGLRRMVTRSVPQIIVMPPMTMGEFLEMVTQDDPDGVDPELVAAFRSLVSDEEGDVPPPEVIARAAKSGTQQRPWSNGHMPVGTD